MSLWELEGETGILGKRENWGIFILRIRDRILIKFNIMKEFMSQSSYSNPYSALFKSQPYLLTLRGVGGESWKTLGVEESG